MCRQLTAVTPAHLCIRPATPPRGTCTPPSGHAGTRSTNTRSISPASPTSTGKPPQAGPNRRRPNTGNHKQGWLLRRARAPRRGGRDHQCRWWLWCVFIFFLFCKGLSTFTGRLTFLLTAGGDDNDDNKEKNGFKILRQLKPAAKSCEECNAAAKLCLCREECTPLPEFASSRRTHPPSGPRFDSRSGAWWLLVTHSRSRAAVVFSHRSVLLSVLSVGGLQAELFCLNVVTVAQTKKNRAYKLSDQSGISTLDSVCFFLFYRSIAVATKPPVL